MQDRLVNLFNENELLKILHEYYINPTYVYNIHGYIEILSNNRQIRLLDEKYMCIIIEHEKIIIGTLNGFIYILDPNAKFMYCKKISHNPIHQLLCYKHTIIAKDSYNSLYKISGYNLCEKLDVKSNFNHIRLNNNELMLAYYNKTKVIKLNDTIINVIDYKLFHEKYSIKDILY